jgi:hypothetical protein
MGRLLILASGEYATDHLDSSHSGLVAQAVFWTGVRIGELRAMSSSSGPIKVGYRCVGQQGRLQQ